MAYKLKVPQDVEAFATMDFKSYYKKRKDVYSKKEAREEFYWELNDYLPEVINFFCAKGHQQQGDIPEAKRLCYDKFLNKDDKDRYVKYLTEGVKEEGTQYLENIIFLPIILREMIQGIISWNAQRKEEDPPMAPPDKLFNLSEAILKKRIKKLKKQGVDQSLAFEVFSIMPCTEAIRYSPWFRVSEIFAVLYKYAETMHIDLKRIFKTLFDEKDYRFIIGYALQERKDKSKGFTETQMALWNDITKFIFDELEEMDQRDIRNILNNYIRTRKKDAEAGKDANRRFYLSSLPESDYPNICRVIQQIKNQDKESEKFL